DYQRWHAIYFVPQLRVLELNEYSILLVIIAIIDAVRTIAQLTFLRFQQQEERSVAEMEMKLLADILPTFEDLSDAEAQIHLDQLHDDYQKWIECSYPKYEDYQYLPDTNEIRPTKGRFRSQRTTNWTQRAASRRHLTEPQSKEQDEEDGEEENPISEHELSEGELETESDDLCVDMEGISQCGDYQDPIFVAWRHRTSLPLKITITNLRRQQKYTSFFPTQVERQ
ncbi:hypothetical protein IFR05_017299, partial [Cadophora sp. M221]